VGVVILPLDGSIEGSHWGEQTPMRLKSNHIRH